VVSPLLSNLYLNEVDQMLERAKAATRYERRTAVEYARFADDLVILVDSHPRQQWLRQAVEKRLREELAKLQVEVNEEKSRKVDLEAGESFGFLGFEFRRVRNRRGRGMPLLLPKGKKRKALLGKLKEIFRSSRSQPVGGVIEKINPILRGWVQSFAIGHASRCFSYIVTGSVPSPRCSESIFQLIGQSEWAKAYYQHLREDQNKTHHAAVRSVAYKWIRILFRCWKDGKPYDEGIYLQSLRRRGSLIVGAFGLPTGAGWQTVAGFQKLLKIMLDGLTQKTRPYPS